MIRPGLLIAGCAALAFVWSGAVPVLAPGPLTSHMVVHVTVVAVAAPLLAFAAAGGAFDLSRRWRLLSAPIAAMLLELFVVWGWHVPVLHHLARTTTAALVAEQASFLGVGLLLWLTAFGGRDADSRPKLGAGVIALLMTSMHMTLLGALITLAPRVLYGHAAGGAAASLMTDQQIAGMVMLFGGATSYLAGGLYLVRRLLQDTTERQSRREADNATLG